MSAKVTERWLLIFVIGVCAVPLLIVAFGSFHMRYIYEDFCHASQITSLNFNFFQKFLKIYNEHRGTFTNILFAVLIPKSDYIGLMLLFAISSLLAASYAALYAFQRATSFNNRSLWAILGGLLLSSGLVSATYNINHLFYWYVALMPHVMPLTALCFYMWIVLSFPKLRLAWAILFSLGFLMAGTSLVFMTSQLVLFSAILVFVWRTPARQAHLAGFIGTTAGSLALVLAPGNFVRLTSYQPDLMYAITHSPYLIGQPLLAILRKAPLVLLAAWLIPSIFAYYHSTSLRKPLAWIIGTPLATLLVSGAAFFPGLYIIGGLSPGWTWGIPIWITLCGTMAFGYVCGTVLRKSHRPLGHLPLRAQIIVAILAVGFMLNGLPIALEAVSRQAAYAAAWDERDAYLRSLSGTTETVRARSFHGAFDLEDLTDDPNFWTNVCIARYYNLPAIVSDGQPPFVP
jgi:hypothetical protein